MKVVVNVQLDYGSAQVEGSVASLELAYTVNKALDLLAFEIGDLS